MVWGRAGKSVPACDWEAGLFIFICIRRRQLLGFMGFVRAPKAEKEKVCPHWGSTGRRQCPSVLGSGKGEQGDLRHSNPHPPPPRARQSVHPGSPGRRFLQSLLCAAIKHRRNAQRGVEPAKLGDRVWPLQGSQRNMAGTRPS